MQPNVVVSDTFTARCSSNRKFLVVKPNQDIIDGTVTEPVSPPATATALLPGKISSFISLM